MQLLATLWTFCPLPLIVFLASALEVGDKSCLYLEGEQATTTP